MEKYREYKDSGVQWLGEIPSHWRYPRLKNALTLLNGRAYSQPELLSEGRYRLLRVGNFFTNDKWYYSNLELEPSKYCDTGDLLYAWSASFGPMIWSGERAIYHYHIWKCIVKETLDKMYAFFMLKSLSEAKRRDVHGSAMVHLTMQDMNQTNIPLPPLREQQAIVSYLNDKCSKIDHLVANKEKELELLIEMKQRVLTDAVTKGVNPNVRFKETGVSWLPRIPEHWTMPRVGNYFKLSDERNTKSMGEVQLLSLYTDLGVFPHGEQKEKGNKAVSVDGYKVVHKNDIVVNIILSWMGAIGMSKYDGVTSPAYDVYCPDIINVLPQYYHYLFRTKGFAGECLKNGRGIMMMRWRTYSTQFKQIRIPLPPLGEQMTIVSYINERVEKIDALAEKLQKEIKSIKEYKQRLISDVVTGQIKVC